MHLPNPLYLLTGALFAGSTIAGHSQRHSRLPSAAEPAMDAIEHAVGAISDATEALGSTVSQRPMSLTKGMAMQKQCWDIANKINQGIEIAQQSKPLNMGQALMVLVATEALVQTVNNTMTAVIKAQPVFASLPLVPLVPFVPHMDAIVLKNLESQSKLSSQFGQDVLLKVPEAGRPDGRDRLDKIARSFAQAIAVYRSKGAVAEETASEEEIVDEKTAVPFTA